MKRGEIRYYTFKAPDKRRPVLILTRDSIIPYLNEITVAAVTSTIRYIPSEILLDASDGLRHACAINCDHIQTIPKMKIGKLITTISIEKMKTVKAALLFALGFDEQEQSYALT